VTELDPHVNVEALRLAVKAMEANPENWDQGVWNGVKLPGAKKSVSWDDVERIGNALRLTEGAASFIGATQEWVEVEQCQTTYCLAGQALLQAGMTNDQGRYVHENGSLMDNWQIEEHAAKLLGLDEEQSESLFYWGVNFGGGTLSKFKEHITEVTGVTFED
jgi:hypothetical protein